MFIMLDELLFVDRRLDDGHAVPEQRGDLPSDRYGPEGRSQEELVAHAYYSQLHYY